MDFQASSLSLRAKIVTATFFFIIFMIILFIIINNPNASLFPKVTMCVVFILALLGLYLLAPTGYELTESYLVLIRRIGSRKIPLSTIREVKRVAKKEFFKGTVRWGVGGVFGFFGKIFSWEIGIYDAFFTNENNAVLVRSDKIFVISPEDPDMFVRKLNEIVQG